MPRATSRSGSFTILSSSGAILEACERAAQTAGFTRLEMGATLTGVPFYRAKGYVELEHLAVPLANGESLPIIRMAKRV